MDAATPVAKIPIVIVEASWLSLWTMAIAARAQAAWTNRHDHLTQLTSDWLTMMRCRRASRAFSNALAISRCAVVWPCIPGARATVLGWSVLLFQVRAGTIFTHPLYACGSYGYPA